MIKDLFNEQDVQAISRMILPCSAREDKLIWSFSKDGNYEVKSISWVLRRGFSSIVFESDAKDLV